MKRLKFSLPLYIPLHGNSWWAYKLQWHQHRLDSRKILHSFLWQRSCELGSCVVAQRLLQLLVLNSQGYLEWIVAIQHSHFGRNCLSCIGSRESCQFLAPFANEWFQILCSRHLQVCRVPLSLECWCQIFVDMESQLWQGKLDLPLVQIAIVLDCYCHTKRKCHWWKWKHKCKSRWDLLSCVTCLQHIDSMILKQSLPTPIVSTLLLALQVCSRWFVEPILLFQRCLCK